MAVLRLLNSPTQMKVIRNNAYGWAKIHSMDWTVDKIKATYLKKIKNQE
jgi:hypothetical protein